MRVAIYFVVLVCAFFGVGCETTPKKAESTKPYQGATFELQLPSFVTAAVEQGDGYAVHYFRMGQSKSMLGVYEGLHPRLFSKKEHDLTVMRRGTTSREGIERGDDAWGVDSNAGIWRESVWSCYRPIRDEKGERHPIPTLLHIWYFGATEEQQGVFDAIVNTIEMREVQQTLR